jgi:hypothetical protein
MQGGGSLGFGSMPKVRKETKQVEQTEEKVEGESVGRSY